MTLLTNVCYRLSKLLPIGGRSFEGVVEWWWVKIEPGEHN